MAELFSVQHKVGSLSEYSPSMPLIRDLYSGEPYLLKVECLDIVGFTGSRLAAMSALRRLLQVDLITAKSILDNLPYRLCQTADGEEYHTQYRATQQLGFAISESSYLREEIA